MHGKPPSFVFNGFDLTPFVKDVDVSRDTAEVFERLGFKPFSGTIVGRWDGLTVQCSGCGVRFQLTADRPTPRVSINGVDLGWACDPCAIAAVNAATE